MWCPRARGFDDLHVELAGDDVVAFNRDTMEYHTFVGKSYDVWLAATGERSMAELAELVFGYRTPNNVLLAQIAVDELISADLMVGEDRDSPAFLSRRTATRLMAAGLLGGIVLPVVKSITVPDSAAAHSHLLLDEAECGEGDSARCKSTCCCQRPWATDFCYDKSTCTGSGLVCI